VKEIGANGEEKARIHNNNNNKCGFTESGRENFEKNAQIDGCQPFCSLCN
jgi:hypothetical protein